MSDQQATLIDTAPACPLGCSSQTKRSGRGWVCSGCGLEWSELGPGATDTNGAKRNPSVRRARASVNHSQAFRDDRPPTRRDDPK
jgi:hypothetical protein